MRRGGHALSAKWNDTLSRGESALRQGCVGPSRRAPATASRPATSSSPADRPPCSRTWRNRPASISRRRRRAARRVRHPQAAHRDVSALRRRQHGRGLDAADVRAVPRAVQAVMDAEIKAGGLDAKYDVIVLPTDSLQAMVGSAGAGASGGCRRGCQRAPADTTPPEYRNKASAPKASRRCRRSSIRAARWSRSARPAICRFNASACRCATSCGSAVEGVLVRRDRRCA